MPRKRARLNPTVLVDLAEMRHRLLNDTAPNANAAHQPPIAVNLPILAQYRVPQIHSAESNSRQRSDGNRQTFDPTTNHDLSWT